MSFLPFNLHIDGKIIVKMSLYLNLIQKSILRTLLYFDIFRHPLKKQELFKLNGIKCSENEFEIALDEIVSLDFIEKISGYYFLKSNPIQIHKTIKKQKRAEKYHTIARYISRIIYSHPFVRAVFISGSLSKSVMSKNDDIDFFVITEPGRLWVSRGLLMIFKKLFLFNSRKYFCINYFVDLENIEIQEKNLFTATELAFIIPLINNPLYLKLMNTNLWIKEFFPNLEVSNQINIMHHEPLFKRLLEKLINGKPAEFLDDFFLKAYAKRSKKKYGKMHKEDFNINLKSKKNISKHHPKGFQMRILNEYTTKINEFEKRFNIKLDLLKD